MSKQKGIEHRSQTGRAGKTCSRCGRHKAFPAFNKDKGVKPDGYARQCRVCRLRTQRKSKKEYLRKVDALKRQRICAKCGEKRTYMLDFHHNIPAEKVASISDLRDRGASLTIIRKEIAKCTVLCANHHRELHYKKITIKEYLKEGTKCT